MAEDLIQDYLKYRMVYYPDSGKLVWKVHSDPNLVGKEAGSLNADGYRVCGIAGKQQKTHRLVFLYMTGELPSGLVDHKNLDRADNRWKNLRLVGYSENGQNAKISSRNQTGVKGVYKIPAKGKRNPSFGAGIQLNGQHLTKQIAYLEGDLVSEAKALTQVTDWVKTTRENLHREFANHG